MRASRWLLPGLDNRCTLLVGKMGSIHTNRKRALALEGDRGREAAHDFIFRRYFPPCPMGRPATTDNSSALVGCFVNSKVRVDDVNDCRKSASCHVTRKTQLTLGLQAGTANQETINILLLRQVLAVLAVDAAAIQDTGLVRDLVANVLLEPLADGGVDLLRLLDSGDLASADGPDGLVGNDDLAPVANLGLEGSQLLLNDGNGLAGLALLQGLAAAPDDAHAAFGRDLGLGGDQAVRLAKDRPALGVAQDGPVDAAVLELGNADLAGERTVGLVKDVLSSNLQARLEMLADEQKVEGRRGDHDLCMASVSGHQIGWSTAGNLTGIGIQLGLVEVLDDGLDGLDGPVPNARQHVLPSNIRRASCPSPRGFVLAWRGNRRGSKLTS